MFIIFTKLFCYFSLISSMCFGNETIESMWVVFEGFDYMLYFIANITSHVPAVHLYFQLCQISFCNYLIHTCNLLTFSPPNGFKITS